MSSFKIYRWHPVGDVRACANGLLVDDSVYGDRERGADQRISIGELKRYAEVIRRAGNIFVSERVANALVIWNAGGFMQKIPTMWEYAHATYDKPVMSREEFLQTVIKPAFELDTADAIKAGGGL